MKSDVDVYLQDTQHAFNGLAGAYDGPLGNNVLIQRMRRRLSDAVTAALPSGSRLLDLGCGTGIDAVDLGQRGYRILATDWSPSMVQRTRDRIARHGLSDLVSAENIGIHQLHQLTGERFDGIYANLGPLNCIPDLQAAAHDCANLLAPGGFFVASVIGRHCPWELVYFLWRRDLSRATLRTHSKMVAVSLNGGRVWTRYYTPNELYGEFAAEFELVWYRSLNLLLPPPYLIRIYDRFRPVFAPIGVMDDWLSSLPVLRNLGDHFLVVLRRSQDG